MSKLEKQQLVKEVVLMDTAWGFILGALIGMLWSYLENLSIMEWWIGIMIWVATIFWLYLVMSKESRKGLEVMESYRLSTWKIV